MGVRAHEHDGLIDVVEREQSRLDLAEFDAQTAQLDLEVGAADVFEFGTRRACVGGLPGDHRTRSPVR